MAHDVVVNRLSTGMFVGAGLRRRLLRLAGLDIGRARIRHGCFFGSADVRIRDDTFVNIGCFFDGVAAIDIGAGCDLGMQVMVLTGGHRPGTAARRAGPLQPGPVAIGDGSWIGARVLLLPGVTIGEGCVVAAGAVVTEDCAAHGVYAGVPARRVRDLLPEASA